MLHSVLTWSTMQRNYSCPYDILISHPLMIVNNPTCIQHSEDNYYIDHHYSLNRLSARPVTGSSCYQWGPAGGAAGGLWSHGSYVIGRTGRNRHSHQETYNSMNQLQVDKLDNSCFLGSYFLHHLTGWLEKAHNYRLCFWYHLHWCYGPHTCLNG